MVIGHLFFVSFIREIDYFYQKPLTPNTMYIWKVELQSILKIEKN